MLVIGNGESRKNLNLTQIKTDVTVGCNAIYRDYCVDHLVCCDRRMVREALDNKFSSTLHTRADWIDTFKKYDNVVEVPKIPYTAEVRADQPFQWGSGSYAVLLACSLGEEISLVGFDLWSNTGLINNVYKGTENYSTADRPLVDPNYWIHQFSKVFQHYSDKYFIVYNKADWNVPERWKINNVEFKNIDFLSKSL